MELAGVVWEWGTNLPLTVHGEQFQYLRFGCPTSIYPSRFPSEESLLAFGYGLLGPERGPHSPLPWGGGAVSQTSNIDVSCWSLGPMPGVMEVLLPRVCPEQTFPVQTTLLWSAFWSHEAVLGLVSPVSP